MLHKGMSKSQIEEALVDKGDFVQIDYLTKFLRQELSLDMKKFTFLKLAYIYEKIGMLDNSATMFHNVALISIAYTERIKNHLKEAELYIKSGNFSKVEDAMKKAMAQANASQKSEILFHIKSFYFKQARVFEKEIKRNNAAKIYEKLLKMNLNLSHQEKEEIKEKLVGLYGKLGRFKDAEMLEQGKE